MDGDRISFSASRCAVVLVKNLLINILGLSLWFEDSVSVSQTDIGGYYDSQGVTDCRS